WGAPGRRGRGRPPRRRARLTGRDAGIDRRPEDGLLACARVARLRLAGGHRRRHLRAPRVAPGTPGRGLRARSTWSSAPLPAERPPGLRGERCDLGRRLPRRLARLGRVLSAPLGDGGRRVSPRRAVHAGGGASGSPRAGLEPRQGALSRTSRAAAVALRPGGREDVPLSARGGDARAEPPLIRRAPLPALPGRPLARGGAVPAPVQLLPRRVPRLRAGPPLHLRLRRREGGLQARVGLLLLLPVLLRCRTVDDRRAPRSALVCPGVRARPGALLRRLAVLAGGEPPQVLVQARPVAEGVRSHRSRGARGARAGERVLGTLAPHQLPG